MSSIKSIFIIITAIISVTVNATCTSVLGGGGSSFTICDDLITSNALPTGGSCSSGVAGSGFGINDASIPAGGDAYDYAGLLWVDNVQVGGVMTVMGQQVSFAPVMRSGLTVQATFDVLSTEATLRNYVSFQNAGATPITVALDYANNYGSDSATTIRGSSSGDLAFGNADTWVVTSDASDSDPVNTTVFGDSGTQVPLSAASTSMFNCATTDGLLGSFSLTVPAGQTVAMVFFHRLSDTSPNAVTTATDFDTVAAASPLLAGLSVAQLDQIVNLGVGGVGADADLSITKTDGVISAIPGDSITYTIVASNAGPSDDPAATVADTFPAGLTCSYTSTAAGGATGNTAAGSGDLAETLNMPNGSSVTYTATCAIDSAATGTLSNTATISGSIADSTPGNNSAIDDDTVLVPTADLSVTKTDGVTSAIPGNNVTYTIVASNAGPSDDPVATVADTFPAGLTCSYTSATAGGATGNTAAGSGDLTETLSMPSGSSVTYTATCDIDSAATGTLSNTATIAGSVVDPNGTNNSATDADTVLNPEADLSITKTDGVTSAIPGNSVTYTIVASNSGPSADPVVTVTDTFPAALTCSFTSVAAGGATGNTNSTGNIADTLSMPTASSVTYTAICAIDSAATGTLSNTATIAGSVVDPAAGNNTSTDNDTVLGSEADLSIVLTSPAPNVVTPGPFTYMIDVTNAGPSNATNVIVTDILSVGFFSVETVGCAEDPNGYQDCSLGSLAPGETASYAITFELGSIDGEITNSVSVTSDATDPTPANNTSSSVIFGAVRTIPTLSQWGLFLSIFLIGLFGFRSIVRVESK